jgi:hypothetical protein
MSQEIKTEDHKVNKKIMLFIISVAVMAVGGVTLAKISSNEAPIEKKGTEVILPTEQAPLKVEPSGAHDESVPHSH